MSPNPHIFIFKWSKRGGVSLLGLSFSGLAVYVSEKSMKTLALDILRIRKE